jgi:hypothetical protein
MASEERDLNSEEYKILCGQNDGTELVFPRDPGVIEDSLWQRPDGSFFRHQLTFDDLGNEVTGHVKIDVTPEQAAKWWTENFIPEVLRPHLSK